MQIKMMWVFQFFVVFILSISTGWFYRGTLDDARQEVAHTNKAIDSIDEVYNMVIISASDIKSYTLFGSQVYLDSFNRSKSDYPLMISRLEGLVSDNPKQLKNVRDFNAAVREKKDFLNQIIKLKQSDSLQTYQGQVQGKALMDAISKIYHEMKTEEYRLLDIRTEKLKGYSDGLSYIIPGFHILNYILLVSSYYMIKASVDEKSK